MAKQAENVRVPELGVLVFCYTQIKHPPLLKRSPLWYNLFIGFVGFAVYI